MYVDGVLCTHTHTIFIYIYVCVCIYIYVMYVCVCVYNSEDGARSVNESYGLH